MKKFNNGKQMRNVWRFTDEEEAEQVSIVKGLKDFASIIDKKHIKKYIVQRPIDLIKRIILASTKEGDLILGPFCSNSTIGIIASQLNRKYIGIMLKNKYLVNTFITIEPPKPKNLGCQHKPEMASTPLGAAIHPWD